MDMAVLFAICAFLACLIGLLGFWVLAPYSFDLHIN